MQSRITKDTESAAQLDVAANRVVAIGRVHRPLHELDHDGIVDLKEYLEDICHDMADMCSEDVIEFEGITTIVATATAIALGFIASELVTIQSSTQRALLGISLGMNPGEGTALSTSYSGPSLPEEFDPAKTKGLA